jgi:hypothetical protein
VKLLKSRVEYDVFVDIDATGLISQVLIVKKLTRKSATVLDQLEPFFVFFVVEKERKRERDK